MLNSTTLEVAVGLVFCYASVSLIVSSINESIASFLKLRSESLLDGIKLLLNDPKFEGLALDLYNHALVNPQSQGNANSLADLKSKPSYIDPNHFAIALIDSIQTAPGNFDQLGKDIDAIQDPQLRQMLQGKYARASGKIENIHNEIAAWFDTGMDRVSGEYKRRSQLYCFIIAFVVAALFNIDTFHLFTTLWQHQHPATGAITAAVSTTDISWNELKALPIGWPDGPLTISFTQVIGWFVTALATLFGAPFWFDILQQVIRLRGTGTKPEPLEKKTTD